MWMKPIRLDNPAEFASNPAQWPPPGYGGQRARVTTSQRIWLSVKGLTHMHITRSLGIGLLIAATAMTGCKNKQKSEMSMLEEENATLRNQLAERTKALEDTNAEKRSLEQQLAALRKDAASPTGSN